MNLTDIVKAFKPRPKSTTTNSGQEPESIISKADADKVASALRSAQGGFTQPLFALYRDIILTHSHIQSELMKRKLAVLGDQFRVLPYDKKVQADKDAAAFCEKAIYEIKGWRMFCSALLDSVIYPVSVVEKVYAASSSGFAISEMIPVPHYLLDYKTGSMMIRAVDEKGKVLETFLEPDPERYIIHRGHLLNTPDQFGGPMRSLVFWWLASVMNREWWIQFLEKFGEGFLIGKYSRPEDRDVILAAFKTAKRLRAMAVTKTTEIELKESSQSGALTFEKFHEIGNREISRLILGQTLSASTDPTGMGSGTSNLQGEVRDDIKQLDGQMLGETIRDQFLVQLCRINGLSGRAPYLSWGSQSPKDQKGIADLLAVLANAGMEPDDDAIEPISERIGFSLRRKSQIQAPI